MASEDLCPLVHRVTFCSLLRHLIDASGLAAVTAITERKTKMSPTIRSVVVPVSDLDAAKAIYTALFGAPHTDQPYYVGYDVDGFEVSLAPGEAAGGPVAYADVDDLDATRATLLAAGATERSAPRQVAPEARVCVLADADGNPIGLRGT
jgi:predicted enzyme related to lactoylglutathione lyase